MLDLHEESKLSVKFKNNLSSKIHFSRDAENLKMVNALSLVRCFISSCLTGILIVAFKFENSFLNRRSMFFAFLRCSFGAVGLI